MVANRPRYVCLNFWLEHLRSSVPAQFNSTEAGKNLVKLITNVAWLATLKPQLLSLEKHQETKGRWTRSLYQNQSELIWSAVADGTEFGKPELVSFFDEKVLAALQKSQEMTFLVLQNWTLERIFIARDMIGKVCCQVWGFQSARQQPRRSKQPVVCADAQMGDAARALIIRAKEEVEETGEAAAVVGMVAQSQENDKKLNSGVFGKKEEMLLNLPKKCVSKVLLERHQTGFAANSSKRNWTRRTLWAK